MRQYSGENLKTAVNALVSGERTIAAANERIRILRILGNMRDLASDRIDALEEGDRRLLNGTRKSLEEQELWDDLMALGQASLLSQLIQVIAD